MTITLYQFSKRNNSTVIPTDKTTQVSAEFVYKDATDLHNPSILLTGVAPVYNYALINNIYFYVTDWMIERNDLMRVQLQIDVLATYRSDIFSTTAYIKYSSSRFNSSIPDERIVWDGVFKGARQVTNMPVFSDTGCFAIQCLGKKANTYSGSTTTYIMSNEQAGALIQEIVYTDDLHTELRKYLANPIDGLISIKWLPFNFGLITSGLTIELVSVGSYTLNNTRGWPLTNGRYVETVGVPIPWIYHDWRDLPPYTTATLNLPGYGQTELNLNDFYGSTVLQVRSFIDLGTADIVYSITRSTESIESFTLKTNVGVDIPIGSTSLPIGSILSSAGTAIAGAIGGNLPIALGGIANLALAGNTRNVSSGGGLGGKASIFANSEAVLTLYSKTNVESPSDLRSLYGAPNCTVSRIGSLSGYCQTTGASVSTTAFAGETATINSTLDSGFYIE